MNDKIQDLLARVTELEEALEEELRARRDEFQFHFEKGRIRFERQALEYHRTLKKSVPRFIRDAPLLTVITSPVIYSLIIPFVLLDLFVTLYQAICFPVYGIAKVKRADYIVADRHLLAYLNWIEKLNCLYCGYGNGLIAYTREIAARTEQYWCPIKHTKKQRDPHLRSYGFVEYGDVTSYRERLKVLREELKRLQE